MTTNRRRSIRTSLWRRNSSKTSSSISQLDNSILIPTNHDTKSPDSVSSLSQSMPVTTEIPIVLEKCKDEIITRGISVEGIFRRSGSVAMIEKLMKEFRMVDDPRLIDLSSVSIHTVAGLFKRYLQQLSEPVIPMSFQPELLNAYESTPNVYQQRNRLIGACQALPQKHCVLLSFVLHIAHTISRHSDQNKMSAENLAIIFAPTCVQLDGLSHLLTDNNTDSTSNSNNTSSNSNSKSSTSSLHIKAKLLRTVSLRLSSNRFSTIPSATSSFASLASQEQGFGNFCRSILSRAKQSTSEDKKLRNTYSVPRYEPNKLMELNLVKENIRWNKLFEFMINHPPLPKFDDQSKQLSLALTTMTATTTEPVEPAEPVPPQMTTPASVCYGTLEDNEDGAHIMMEVINATMAALSVETAEFFESILESNLDSRYRSPRATVANDAEDAGSKFAIAWKDWWEKETQPMPQLWKRNSVAHHHRQKHRNDWIKSLSQNIDFVAPAKKRPLSFSFIPRTQSRLSAFLR